MINAQTWLQEKFPTPQDKEKVKLLNISMSPDTLWLEFKASSDRPETEYFFKSNENSLRGNLDLVGFTNLEKLGLSNLGLTALNLSNCAKLTHLGLYRLDDLKEVNLEANKILKALKVDGCPKIELFSWKEELETLRIQVQNQPELRNQITQLEQNLTQSQETGRVSEQTRIELARQKQALEEQIRNNTQTHQQELAQLQTNIEQYLTCIQDLETQLATTTEDLNQELDKTQQLQENLTNSEEQKRLQAIDLQSQIEEKAAKSQRILDLGQELSAVKEQLEVSQRIQQETVNLKQTFNQQLKELNILIDPQAEYYTEPIEFSGFKAELEKSLSELRAEKKELVKELESKTVELKEAQAKAEETKQELQNNVDLLQKKITDLETQLLNLAKQKIKTKAQGKELLTDLTGKFEEKQKELVSLTEIHQKQSRSLAETKQELAQSLASNQILEQGKTKISEQLSETKESLQTKQEQLKKTRLEVVGLQAQLKKSKPEPIKPTSVETQPINPWIPGIALVAGISLYLLLNRRKE